MRWNWDNQLLNLPKSVEIPLGPPWQQLKLLVDVLVSCWAV
jgi:hypothetical protein